MSDFPEFQHKPAKTPNYKEKVKLGLISGGLKRTSSLSPVSKKHKKELDKYRNQCYNDAEIQKCFICGREANKDILDRHHTHGRNKDNILIYEYVCKDETMCLKEFEVDGQVVVERGHRFIHTYPNKARELGLLFF